MDKLQVLELIENMATVYPNKLEVNEKTVNTFHFHLQDQDYNSVMKNFKLYARDNRFPPTISDLLERRKMDYELEDPLKKISKWEEEASGGPKR
jgi:hypothetical protein